jgi:hypothetical protein
MSLNKDESVEVILLCRGRKLQKLVAILGISCNICVKAPVLPVVPDLKGPHYFVRLEFGILV